MKSAWIGIGFSHHKVPSLSKTATRSSGGTPADTVRSAKSTTARLAVPSFQLASSPITVAIPRHHYLGLGFEVGLRVAADVSSRNSPHSEGGNGHSYGHHPPRVSNRSVKSLESRELASL
jgi:hypothetical protein